MQTFFRQAAVLLVALATQTSPGQTKTLKYSLPQNIAAPTEYYGDSLRLVENNSEVTQITKPVRERSKIRLSVKPANSNAGSIEYQVALAPMTARLSGSKLGDSLIQYGAVSPGTSDIGPILGIPFLPDFDLASATQKFVQSNTGDLLNIKALKSLLGSSSTAALTIASRIYSTGECPIFVRTIRKNSTGAIVACSNNVRIDLTERPISSLNVGAVFYNTLTNPDGAKQPEYFQSLNTSTTKLAIKFFFSDGSLPNFKVQLSRTPFASEPGTWSSPNQNLAQVKVAAPANLKPGEFADAIVDFSPAVPPAGSSPKTYFVRVLPVDAKGRLLGSPSNTLTWIHQTKPTLFLKTAPPPSPEPRTAVSVSASYSPATKDHPDAARHWILKEDIKVSATNVKSLIALAYADPQLPASTTFLPKGTRLLFPPSGTVKESGWVDIMFSAISSIVEAIQSIVNWASQAYSDLQVILAKAVGSLTGVDPDLVLAGIKFGLTALGIPPEIPNFQQMVDQGFDYVVAQAVSASGLPDSEYLRDKLKTSLKQGFQEVTQSGPKTPDPWVPDPNYLAKPALVELTFRARWLPEGTNEQPRKSAPFTINLSANAKLSDQGSQVFTRTILKKPLSVPSMSPGQVLSVKLPVSEFDSYWVSKTLEQNAEVMWTLGGKSTKSKFQSTWSILAGP